MPRGPIRTSGSRPCCSHAPVRLDHPIAPAIQARQESPPKATTSLRESLELVRLKNLDPGSRCQSWMVECSLVPIEVVDFTQTALEQMWKASAQRNARSEERLRINPPRRMGRITSFQAAADYRRRAGERK